MLPATPSRAHSKRAMHPKEKCMPLKALPTIDELKVTSEMDTSFEDFHDDVAAMKLQDISLQDMEEGNATNTTPDGDNNMELAKEHACPCCKTCAGALCATGVSLVLCFIVCAIIWASYTDAQLPQW